MINPATETSREDYDKCANCRRNRCEHHYGADGHGSAFVFQSTVLYCPSQSGVFKKGASR